MLYYRTENYNYPSNFSSGGLNSVWLNTIQLESGFELLASDNYFTTSKNGLLTNNTGDTINSNGSVTITVGLPSIKGSNNSDPCYLYLRIGLPMKTYIGVTSITAQVL